MPDTWQDIAKRKQEERNTRIPHEWRLRRTAPGGCRNVLHVPRQCGILNDNEIKITEQYDATALCEELAAGAIRSEDVVRAFCKRAAIAQQLTNCLTEILFEDALTRARELDRHLERTGKPIGPLHGLPISLKDTFKIRGYDASIGIASLCFKPAVANSALVNTLISLGAVLYCKTNVPQTMMALDSHNNVFGRTINPANAHLTPGGSSGGEGALLAMRGSILGVGTDVGGSIRIPAACNGLYGMKPSHGRIPYTGQEGGKRPGSSRIEIEATAGPLATTVRDLELFMHAVCNARTENFDTEVIPQTWTSLTPLTTPDRPLRLGIVRTDGHVKPVPPIESLMEQVAQTLRSSSGASERRIIEVVNVDISPILSRALKTFNGIVSLDGNNQWLDLLERTGEPLSPWLRSRVRRKPQKPTTEVVTLHAARLDLQTAFLQVWKESGGYWMTDVSEARLGDKVLDALVCPVAPHPIPEIDRFNTANYTSAWNLLDLSVGVVPVRRFNQQDLTGEVPTSEPLNGWDKINRELWTKVDRAVYLDSPLSVQVVTPRLTERKLVQAMAVIDEAVRPLREGHGKGLAKGRVEAGSKL
ncbi:hypothetical protein DOTSEDRAFT_69881 [Dothistroma septosporum NZE10]|uniref:amidase n=1 Tax=Dothistroma septosporum (strain NZE10 / CBS 128990) TaxID=675120 RepID=N1Q0V9_DOTSN|nr:hypothetical protein DOTSEDRAFT_69881 [Dothistroma septosporum NZE10]